MKITTKDERIQWIDIAKGFGILLVLFSHTITSYIRQTGNASILSSLPVVAVDSFFMPLFFYISGIFICSNLNRNFWIVLKNKFKRLMIPYFVWGFISCLFLGIYSQHNPTLRILELPIRPIFVLWFVYSMFLSIILFWILQTYCSNWFVLIISIILYVIGYVGGSHISVDSFFKPLLGLSQNFIFVYLGFLSNNFVLKKRNVYSSYLFVLLAFSCLIILNTLNFNHVVFRIIIRFMCGLVGTIGVCELSKIVESWNLTFNFLTKFGLYSMQIYLIHKLVVEVVSIVLVKLTANLFVFTTLNIIITLIICFAVVKLIKVLKFEKIFFGN